MMPELWRSLTSRRRGSRWIALLSVLGLVSGPLPAATGAPTHELVRSELLLRRYLSRLSADASVVVERQDEQLVLRFPVSLLFDPDSTTLTDRALTSPPVAAAVHLLRARHALSADVAVYTDDIGGSNFNQSVSTARAQALAAALSARVSVARLRQRGVGAQNALAGNDTPEGRIRNRRVEIAFRLERATGP